MPNPAEGNPPPFLKGEGDAAERVAITPGPGEARRRARVQGHDRPVRRQARHLPRAPGHGEARARSCWSATRASRSRSRTSSSCRARTTSRSRRRCPGDICAVPKIDEIHFDAVLHDSHDEDHYHLKSVSFPPPMLGLAIRAGEARRRAEAVGVRCTASWPRTPACASSTTRRRTRPCFTVSATCTCASCCSADRPLRRRRQDQSAERAVSRDDHAPGRRALPAQEADRRRRPVRRGVPARSSRCRAARVSSSSDDVVGGAIPGQFIPAVEKGVRQVLGDGAIAGFALQDLRVSVYDGKHHAVDSKEVAFVSAGKQGLRRGDAGSEPDRARADRARRDQHAGRRRSATSPATWRRDARASAARTPCPAAALEIAALVPLAELQDYLSRLKALTGGEGTLHDGPEPLRPGASTQSSRNWSSAFKPQEETE